MRRAASGETKRTPDAVEEAVTTAAAAAALCAAGPCGGRAASCAAALPVRTIAEKMIEKIRRAVCMMFLFWLCAGDPFLILLRPEPLPNPKSPSTSNAQTEAERDHIAEKQT